MTKENYLELKQYHENEIEEARQKLKNNETRYIMANREFADGDRIKITEPAKKAWSSGFKNEIEIPERVRYAYIEEAHINYDGNILYKLKAEKKDGSISKQNDYCSHVDWLSLA